MQPIYLAVYPTLASMSMLAGASWASLPCKGGWRTTYSFADSLFQPRGASDVKSAGHEVCSTHSCAVQPCRFGDSPSS